MNLNGDEKRIERLFREMRREDEARTPSIQSVLNRKTGAIWERRWSMAVAGGLAMLVVALLVALLSISRSPKPIAPDERVDSTPPPVQQVAPIQQAVAQPATPRIIKARARRHPRSSDQLMAAIKLLSAWRSPTASLLSFPAEDRLKTLPRLDESLETIKSLSTDQFN